MLISHLLSLFEATGKKTKGRHGRKGLHRFLGKRKSVERSFQGDIVLRIVSQRVKTVTPSQNRVVETQVIISFGPNPRAVLTQFKWLGTTHLVKLLMNGGNGPTLDNQDTLL